MSSGEYNTTAARIIRPIAVLLIVIVCLKVVDDRTEGFFGIKSELNDANIKAYFVFALLSAVWLIYELVLSIRFFMKK